MGEGNIGSTPEKPRSKKQRRRDVIVGATDTIVGLGAVTYSMAEIGNGKIINAADSFGIHPLTTILLTFGIALSAEMLAMLGMQRVVQGVTGRNHYKELE